MLYAYFVAYLHKLICGCDLNFVSPLLESNNKKSRNGVMGVGCLIYITDDRISWMHLCYHFS